MDPQKPRTTEIQVRIDCNGCVQKIKKALHGIEGISDVCIDFPQQKLTISGWADPERIVKAIRKTRKTATICSDSEQPDPAAQPMEPSPPAEPDPLPPENPQPLPPETPVINDKNSEHPIPGPRHSNRYPDSRAFTREPAQAFPPSPIYVTHSYNMHRPSAYVTEYENTMSPPKQAYYSRNDQHSNTRIIPGPGNASDTRISGPRNAQEAYVTYHNPPAYRYEHQNRYPNAQAFPQEPASVPHNPIYGVHRNNTYRSSPYVNEYEYIVESPPRQAYYHSRNDQYSNEYQISSNNNADISSMFSDENPNACKII